MKNILTKSIIGLFAAASLTACQEVIDIELNEADRAYVVEGGITEGQDSIVVRLTKTTSYFDTSTPQGLSDGTVVATLADGSTVQLTSYGNGVYMADNLNLPVNSTYALNVDVDGKTFTASTFIPAAVPIDSLEGVYNPGFGGQGQGYDVYVNYQDPIGKNWYKINTIINGIPSNDPSDIMVFDDNLNDGNPIRIPVFVRIFDPGDTVDVQLQAIDQPTFDFYNTLSGIVNSGGGPFDAAPANPVSNIKGGALGIWGGYTSSWQSVILPE